MNDRLTGTIPRSRATASLGGLVAGGFKRALHAFTRNAPLAPTARAALHRLRGVRIGKNVFIGTEVFIDDAEPDQVVIEDDAVILARSTLIAHGYYPERFRQFVAGAAGRRGIAIRRGAYLGVCVTVLPGVEIGEDAMVAAGAVVVESVPPRTLVAGVPARVVRELK